MTAKLKPDWAGEDLLSRFVNVLIQTKPIYGLMKQQARNVLIKTAEKNGIPWRQTVQDFESSGIHEQLAAIANPDITYPDYYNVPFHAYDRGNLCWLAAFEAAPATYSMALRVWPNENLTWKIAQDRLRSSFHEVLATHGPKEVRDMLDIGCSVGISTLALHQYYATQQQGPVTTVGLDLSPYMLAVAQNNDVDCTVSQWIHGKGEETGLPDRSFDLVTLQFLIHELPYQASRAIFQEALRVLRPNGCLAIVDNNPKSPVIQGLPPVLFALMKSTEPWSDDYYTFDVEAALIETGFETPITVASDPRHRTIVARKNSTQ
ncbi:MAG: methyltransferase domain-containing protein [Acaryochloridaceae cyanobacterium RU_4_10]|nr:methyltransferase domain-containing protein [Acaryochloridaceae cyanobacterium RU_4_10]